MIYNLPVETSGRPADWVVKPLADIAKVVGGGTPDTGNPEYWNPPEIPWVTPTDITKCSGPVLEKTERGISQAGLRDSSATPLPVGATLLTSRATIGECRLAGVPVATNQGFASLVPRDPNDSHFLFYLAQSVKPVFVRLAAGTTFAEVSRREIRRVNVCVPTEPGERAEIGPLLETSDRALAAAEAKLAAARQLKTALMQQLFTRGIPGRHSCFEQTKIGEIPTGWKIKRVSDVVSGNIYNGLSPQSRPDPPGVPILNVSCISSGRCNPRNVTYVNLLDKPHEDLIAHAGDFYVLRGNGNREYIATGGLLTEEPPPNCVFSDLLIKIPFDPDKTVRGFMPLLWQSHEFLRRLQSKAVSGSGLWKIGLREIRRHDFAEPPREEQEEIVNALRAAGEYLSTCEAELHALGRLKQSLLQNLLTGRVRVRVESGQ
jgi:type I restriction enzyme S subunit